MLLENFLRLQAQKLHRYKEIEQKRYCVYDSCYKRRCPNRRIEPYSFGEYRKHRADKLRSNYRKKHRDGYGKCDTQSDLLVIHKKSVNQNNLYKCYRAKRYAAGKSNPHLFP